MVILLKVWRTRIKLSRRRMKLSRRRMNVSRTRIHILVLANLKRITFLCGKLRKDDKFLRFPHKNIILYILDVSRIMSHKAYL